LFEKWLFNKPYRTYADFGLFGWLVSKKELNES